jgi:hypothetical protein
MGNHHSHDRGGFVAVIGPSLCSPTFDIKQFCRKLIIGMTPAEALAKLVDFCGSASIEPPPGCTHATDARAGRLDRIVP